MSLEIEIRFSAVEDLNTESAVVQQEDIPQRQSELVWLFPLGKGAQGSVTLLYDLENFEYLALKTMNAPYKVSDMESHILKTLQEMSWDKKKTVTCENLESIHDYPCLEANLGNRFIQIRKIDKTEILSERGIGDLFQFMQYRCSSGFSLNEVLQIAKDIYIQLEILWELKIYHRDLKPNNLIVRKNGYIVIIDFGCAEKNGSGYTHITHPITGTKGFYPSEWDNLPESSQVSLKEGDIFAFGEILTILLKQCHERDKCSNYDLTATQIRCDKAIPKFFAKDLLKVEGYISVQGFQTYMIKELIINNEGIGMNKAIINMLDNSILNECKAYIEQYYETPLSDNERQKILLWKGILGTKRGLMVKDSVQSLMELLNLLYKKKSNSTIKAEAHYNLGVLYWYKNERQKSIRHHETALSLRKQTVGLYEILEQKLADVKPQQVNQVQQVLDTDFSCDYSEILSGILFQIGQNQLQKDEQLEQKIFMIKQIVFGSVAQSYNNLGNAYLQCEKEGEAEKCYQQAYDIRKSLFNNEVLMAQSCRNFAYLTRQKKQYELALEWNDKAMNWLKKTKHEAHSEFKIIYGNTAEIYYSLKDYQNAIKYYEKALSIYSSLYKTNQVLEIGKIKLFLSYCSYYLGRFEKTEIYLTESKKDISDCQDIDLAHDKKEFLEIIKLYQDFLSKEKEKIVSANENENENLNQLQHNKTHLTDRSDLFFYV